MKIQLDDRIIGSDAFLSLSHTAQCLYFALFRARDNDGVVNKTKSVMMATSREDGKDVELCQEKHLQELINGSFLIDFRKSDGVVIIKHHWLHTTYKSDRYIPSTYDCVNRLFVKSNGVYTEDETQGKPYLENKWKNNGKNLEENSFPNLIKSNLIKSNILKNKNIADKKIGDVVVLVSEDDKTTKSDDKKPSDLFAERFEMYWKAYNNHKGSKAKAKQWFITHKVSEETLNSMLQAIKIDDVARDEAQIMSEFYPQKPYATTWLNQKRWETLLENVPQSHPQGTKGSSRENIPPQDQSLPTSQANGEIDDIEKLVAEFEASKKGK